jgi:hypothetical protein
MPHHTVNPAKTGAQTEKMSPRSDFLLWDWTPAFAGLTRKEVI